MSEPPMPLLFVLCTLLAAGTLICLPLAWLEHRCGRKPPLFELLGGVRGLLVIGASVVSSMVAGVFIVTYLGGAGFDTGERPLPETVPVIEGVIVDDATGMPVPGVRVARWPERQVWSFDNQAFLGGFSVFEWVVTDATGHFRLPGGRWRWGSVDIFALWPHEAVAMWEIRFPLRVHQHDGEGLGRLRVEGMEGGEREPSRLRLSIRLRRQASVEDVSKYVGSLWRWSRMGVLSLDATLAEVVRCTSHGVGADAAREMLVGLAWDVEQEVRFSSVVPWAPDEREAARLFVGRVRREYGSFAGTVVPPPW